MQRGAKKLTETIKNIFKCPFIDNLGDFSWAQRAVDAEEACDVTSNVRSSLGSSRYRVGPPIFPSGSDVLAGSKDINAGAKVGVLGHCIIESGISYSDHFRKAAGGVFFRVLGMVSGSCDDGNTGPEKLKTE